MTECCEKKGIGMKNVVDVREWWGLEGFHRSGGRLDRRLQLRQIGALEALGTGLWSVAGICCRAL